MPTYAAPGLFLEPPRTLPQPVAPLRTDVAAFVGIAERGPVGLPTWVSSWQQFTAAFGGFLPGAFLAYSVKAFYDNGGDLCVVVRAAAQTAETTGTGAPAGRDSSQLVSVAGFAVGALASVSQREGSCLFERYFWSMRWLGWFVLFGSASRFAREGA